MPDGLTNGDETMKKTLIALALAAGLTGTAGAVFASTDDVRVDAPRDQWMSAEQISAKLTADGFDVREVDEDDGVYEVEALNAKGEQIGAYVHPVTGEVIESEIDD
jgi:transketolase N-terminal domain/subunit